MSMPKTLASVAAERKALASMDVGKAFPTVEKDKGPKPEVMSLAAYTVRPPFSISLPPAPLDRLCSASAKRLWDSFSWRAFFEQTMRKQAAQQATEDALAASGNLDISNGPVGLPSTCERASLLLSLFPLLSSFPPSLPFLV